MLGYVHFLICCREISARTSHGSPKLRNCPLKRRVAETDFFYACLGALRAICHAYGACIVRCVSRACRPCCVPGISPARGVHLEHGTFSQAGKMTPPAHQARKQLVTKLTRSTDDADISDPTEMAHVPGTPPSTPRCQRQLVLLQSTNAGRTDFPGCPGYPRTGIVPSWSKPCSFFCETLVAGTATCSNKFKGRRSVPVPGVCTRSNIPEYHSF